MHKSSIGYNVEVLPKVGRKSATASPKHKSLIVALMLIVGWSAPLLAIYCWQQLNFELCQIIALV